MFDHDELKILCISTRALFMRECVAAGASKDELYPIAMLHNKLVNLAGEGRMLPEHLYV